MEPSTILLTICFVVFALVLASLFLWTMRQMRADLQSQKEAMATTLQIQMKLSENSSDSLESAFHQQAERASQLAEGMLQETVRAISEATSQNSKALEQASLVALNGWQASEGTLSKILMATTAALATSDTLAYNQVMFGAQGANPAQPASVEPYTAADDAEEARLAAKQAEDLLLSFGARVEN